MKILLVDDESVILASLERILSKLGYTIEIAQDGLEALEKFHADPQSIDMIITDLKMPKMNGVELIETVRSEGYETSAILITGHLDESKFDTLDNTCILFKPFSCDKLISILTTSFPNAVQQCINH